MHIDFETLPASGSQRGETEVEVRQSETQDVIQHTQRDITKCRARAIENAGNSGSSAEKLIELIGSRYVNAVSYTHLTLPTNREV